MSEERTITISTEEYAEFMMCRTRLNILATYVEQNNKSYLDDEFIALILGASKKEVK